MAYIQRARQGALAAALALCFDATARGATIPVDDPGTDSIPGKCTLPDAVAALNTATAVNACIAGDGNGDTISLRAFTAPTTISFTQATSADGLSAIGLTREARLIGPLGADGKPLVTIARNTSPGTPKFRVIGTTALLAIDGLAITGGDSTERGGGIAQLASDLSYQYLRIVNSVISGNTTALSGGGVSFDCATTLIHASTIRNNTAQHDGGGVYSTSKGGPYDCYTTLSVARSTIADNTASADGGGISQFAGEQFIAYTTISGNTAARGAGIYAYGNWMMTNATITGNVASVSAGAIYSPGSAAYMTSATVAGNSCSDPNAPGGIVSGHMHSDASIVRGNTGVDLQVTSLSGTYFLSGSNNIIHAPQTPNTAVNTLDCDPLLGPLADNGGATQTMSLGTGSCAIDAGPALPAVGFVTLETTRTDQRGAHYLRLSGNAVDIGAFETQPNERIFTDAFQLDAVPAMFFPPTL